jgi:hypothetical protein
MVCGVAEALRCAVVEDDRVEDDRVEQLHGSSSLARTGGILLGNDQLPCVLLRTVRGTSGCPGHIPIRPRPRQFPSTSPAVRRPTYASTAASPLSSFASAQRTYDHSYPLPPSCASSASTRSPRRNWSRCSGACRACARCAGSRRSRATWAPGGSSAACCAKSSASCRSATSRTRREANAASRMPARAAAGAHAQHAPGSVARARGSLPAPEQARWPSQPGFRRVARFLIAFGSRRCCSHATTRARSGSAW